MKKSMIAIMALPLIAASCSNQENEPRIPGGVAMTVTAQVKQAASRAGYSIENLKEFALIVDNPTAPDFNINTRIEQSGNGWNAFDGTPLLWDTKLNTVEAVAFAPYRDNVTLSTTDLPIEVMADQSSEEAVLASDFLIMPKSTVTPTADNKTLNVVLSHKLTKLIITVKGGKEEIRDMKINGLKLRGTVDLSKQDAPLTLTGEAAPVVPYSNEGSYEAIVMPQTLSEDFTISFKDGDELYRWTYTGAGRISEGHMYAIGLEINKPAQVRLSDGITAGSWNNNGGSTYFTFEE